MRDWSEVVVTADGEIRPALPPKGWGPGEIEGRYANIRGLELQAMEQESKGDIYVSRGSRWLARQRYEVVTAWLRDGWGAPYTVVPRCWVCRGPVEGLWGCGGRTAWDGPERCSVLELERHPEAAPPPEQAVPPERPPWPALGEVRWIEERPGRPVACVGTSDGGIAWIVYDQGFGSLTETSPESWRRERLWWPESYLDAARGRGAGWFLSDSARRRRNAEGLRRGTLLSFWGWVAEESDRARDLLLEMQRRGIEDLGVWLGVGA